MSESRVGHLWRYKPGGDLWEVTEYLAGSKEYRVTSKASGLMGLLCAAGAEKHGEWVDGTPIERGRNWRPGDRFTTDVNVYEVVHVEGSFAGCRWPNSETVANLQTVWLDIALRNGTIRLLDDEQRRAEVRRKLAECEATRIRQRDTSQHWDPYGA